MEENFGDSHFEDAIRFFSFLEALGLGDFGREELDVGLGDLGREITVGLAFGDFGGEQLFGFDFGDLGRTLAGSLVGDSWALSCLSPRFLLEVEDPVNPSSFSI